MLNLFFILLNCLVIVSCAGTPPDLPKPTGLFVPINKKPEPVQTAIIDEPKPAKVIKKRRGKHARKIR